MAQWERISSRDNARVKQAVRLAIDAAARAEAGLFFAEGLRLCCDLAETVPPAVAFVEQGLLKREPRLAKLAAETFEVNTPVAEKLAGTRNTQGLFCLFPLPQPEGDALDAGRGVLLCEAVQDPANLGAMLRCAAGFGLGGAVLTPGCADPYAPKALRAAMGCTLRLPVVPLGLEEALLALRERGATVYAAALGGGARPLPEVAPKRPFALLVGNEGAGLSEAALNAADLQVYIPMHNGVESLNAAAATAALLYHFTTR